MRNHDDCIIIIIFFVKEYLIDKTRVIRIS